MLGCVSGLVRARVGVVEDVWGLGWCVWVGELLGCVCVGVGEHVWVGLGRVGWG